MPNKISSQLSSGNSELGSLKDMTPRTKNKSLALKMVSTVKNNQGSNLKNKKKSLIKMVSPRSRQLLQDSNHSTRKKKQTSFMKNNEYTWMEVEER